MEKDTQPRDEGHEREAPADRDVERRAKSREAAPDPSVPFDPDSDDESAVGDTDEHSSA